MSTRKLVILSRFDYDPDNYPGLRFEHPSMTQQQFAEDANINNIIAKFQKTGVLADDADPNSLPLFGDFSQRSASDYQTAMNVVVRAREQFDSLPSDIRERFGYSPKALLKFLGDQNNYAEAVRLGLVRPDPLPDPAPLVPADPPAPPSNADK